MAASYTAVAGAPLLVRGHTLVREHILVAASYAAVAGAPLLVRGHTLVREHILVAASYAAVPLLVRGLDQKLAGDDVVCV